MREKEIESSSFKEADSSYLTPFSIVEAHTVSGWDGLCLFIDLKGGKEAEEGSLLSSIPFYGCITISLCIYLFIDSWVVLIFGNYK